MTKLSRERLSQYFFLIILALIVWLSYSVLELFLTSILLSIILSYYFYPAYTGLTHIIKNRSLSALLVILMILLIIVPPATYVVLKLANEAVLAFQHVGTSYGTLTKDFLVHALEQRIPVEEMLMQGAAQIVTFTKANAQKIISSVSNAVLQLFIFFFIMYYCFKDGAHFFSRVEEVLPLTPKQKKVLVHELTQMIHGVIHGQFTTAILQGILGGIGLWIFGVTNPVFWGFVMFVLSFLPIIGGALIWAPGGLWLIVQGHTYAGIGLWAYGVIILANIDNIVRPKLIHQKTQLHPALVFLGVLGGLAAFGFSGILLGPIVLLMLTVLVRFYKEENMRKNRRFQR